MLTQKVASKPYTEWFEKFKAHDKIEFDEVINNDLNPTKEGLSMAEVLKEINRSSNSDAIVVSDVGQHQMIACRYATFNHSV